MQQKEERKKIIILDKGTKDVTPRGCCFLAMGPYMSAPEESRPSRG